MAKKITKGKPVTLAIGDIFNLWAALSAMERDEALKLDAETRLEVAININRLLPLATAYERARAAIAPSLYREAREKMPTGYPIDKPLPNDIEAEVNAKVIEQDQKLRERTEDVPLCLFSLAVLRIADNPKIRLSSLLPIISDAE